MNYRTFKFFRKLFGKHAINHEEKILEKASDITYYRSLYDEEEADLYDRMYVEARMRSQREGHLAVISFDMKNSRDGYDDELLQKLFDEYYLAIRKYEAIFGINILHDPEEKIIKSRNGGFRNGHFRLGDLFSFPIEYEYEVEPEFFIYVFQKVKKKLGVEYMFHFILLRYDTDYFADGYDKYTLMDAFKDSEELSKKKKDLV